jgi:2-polyprenyl-6-methoxyphenol hydroxylase-like FAD-dependent oxidoreductase
MGESRAVVVGASMAGLMAARVLSDHYGSVTVIERDQLSEEPEPRKGVPQGRHAHGLLASGYRVFEHYFPGLSEELVSRGALQGDVSRDVIWYLHGSQKLRFDSGLVGLALTRALLESGIRGRVRALQNVSFREETDAEEPIYDPASGRVTGLRTKDRNSGVVEDLEADLVVDASGRGSQSPRWLEQWGYGRPEESILKINVTYVSRLMRRTSDDFPDAATLLVGGKPPEQKVFAAAIHAEGDRVLVTLGGLSGVEPPLDDEGWLEFAKRIPLPGFHRAVARWQPLTELVQHRFPSDQRRHYEKMARFPEGYLVIGDAICSFNPVYGQGMSVAALEARTLDEVLRAGRADVAPRFFKRASKTVDIAWMLATGEDLRYPEVEGPRPAASGVVNAYMSRVHRVACVDPVVCKRFFEVANLLKAPSSIFAPGIAFRVLRPRRNGGRVAGVPEGAAASG